MKMRKTISAEFESVDLAELAARNIRYRFEGITRIRIRYRAGSGEYDTSIPVAVANNSLGVGFPQAYDSVLYYDTPQTEIDQNRSSLLLVEAGERSAERIAAYLRGLGGLGIKISDEN